jgi:hypothetical protein
MPEIGTSSSMSGDGKRGVGHRPQATAPILDSTIDDKAFRPVSGRCGRWTNLSSVIRWRVRAILLRRRWLDSIRSKDSGLGFPRADLYPTPRGAMSGPRICAQGPSSQGGRGIGLGQIGGRAVPGRAAFAALIAS